MKIGRKFFKIRSREINSSAIILMSSVMCCTDFRDCRMCSPGLGRGGWPRLVGRSIRDNNCPAAIQAQPDAFLSIFKSHTFSIYKIALTRHAELSCRVWTVNKLLFCEIHYQLGGDTVRLVRIMFLMGLKVPRKLQVFLRRKRITCKIFMEGVNDRVALKRMIFHNFCIKTARLGHRQKTWCITECLQTDTNAWDNQFPSS